MSVLSIVVFGVENQNHHQAKSYLFAARLTCGYKQLRSLSACQLSVKLRSKNELSIACVIFIQQVQQSHVDSNEEKYIQHITTYSTGKRSSNGVYVQCSVSGEHFSDVYVNGNQTSLYEYNVRIENKIWFLVIYTDRVYHRPIRYAMRTDQTVVYWLLSRSERENKWKVQFQRHHLIQLSERRLR